MVEREERSLVTFCYSKHLLGVFIEKYHAMKINDDY